MERALYRRAVGYEYTEHKVEYSEKSGEKAVDTVKHVPGDTTAMMLWLKNRAPERWQDRPQPVDPAQVEAHRALILALGGEPHEAP